MNSGRFRVLRIGVFRFHRGDKNSDVNGAYTKSLSLRSRRKHKAWGASPRLTIAIENRARVAGESP